MYECDSVWCACTDTWALGERLKNKGMRQKQTWKTRPRTWHPTPVLLPRISHGWRSLVGCSPWGREELDRTDRLHYHFHFQLNLKVLYSKRNHKQNKPKEWKKYLQMM